MGRTGLESHRNGELGLTWPPERASSVRILDAASKEVEQIHLIVAKPLPSSSQDVDGVVNHPTGKPKPVQVEGVPQ